MFNAYYSAALTMNEMWQDHKCLCQEDGMLHFIVSEQHFSGVNKEISQTDSVRTALCEHLKIAISYLYIKSVTHYTNKSV